MSMYCTQMISCVGESFEVLSISSSVKKLYEMHEIIVVKGQSVEARCRTTNFSTVCMVRAQQRNEC